MVTGSLVFGDSVQISGVGGDVTVSSDRPPYRVTAAENEPVPLSAARARAQPSRLLLARHRIVPFAGRRDTLDQLAAWMSGDAPIGVMLVHAAGGQGKTRLAAHVSAQAGRAGWAVWQITHTPTPVPGSTGSKVDLSGAAALAVVDYADRWPASALLAFLAQLRDLHAGAGTQVRVLMLARSDAHWWPALADRAESDLGVDVDEMPLPELSGDGGDDRAGMFAAAADSFAAAMDVAAPARGWPAPELRGTGYGQVLAVHMAALAAVDAHRHGQDPPGDPGAVSAYLLRREQAYWQHLHTRAEAPVRTPPEVMHRAVLAATLTGAQPRPTARLALASARFTATDEGSNQIIDDHTVCYPPADGRTAFEPLHPDRLGEDLIALTVPGHRDDRRLGRDWASEAITGLLAGDSSPVWAAAAVTVLVETARRWPHVASTVLYPFVLQHPERVIAAGGATVTRLAGIPGIDPAVLQALEPLLPAERHIDLDIAAAAITSTLTAHRLARTDDSAEQAHLHATNAYRLANAGHARQAVAPAGEAIAIYRRLAAADPEAYLSLLGTSLSNLGAFLADSGRREQALAATQEAVTIRRRLAEADPAAHLPDLAASLNNLGIHLSGQGRHQQSLAPAREAVEIRRRLAQADPETYLPQLSTSLNNLSVRLYQLGRPEQALAPAEEATDIHRRLAEIRPAASLPNLAASLHYLGLILPELGHREQALARAQEAVELRRRLAQINPAVYLPHLTASLNNLSVRLAELGRREQALVPAQEATDIYHRLAEDNPDAHLAGLATTLNNLGNSLLDLGRREQALAPMREAAGIHRRLVSENADLHLPGLATSLNNLSATLGELGRRDEALAPAQEASDIYRRLAEDNPDAYLPNLATTLNNLGNRLSMLGRREQALVFAEEAVGIRRRLARAQPDTHLPGLAASLNDLGSLLSELGRREQALAPAHESVTIRRRLAAVDPEAYRPFLATSLLTYGWVCVRAKTNLAEALEAVTEAISVYEPLNNQLNDMYAERLSFAYRTLADVLESLGRTEEADDLRRRRRS
ncbi:tetratricopeptide repeat protein [Actinoplanes sp. NPDC049598]|uniref:tetratricopeptide repeat protein n=1 Tax=Actinoplanes sp. NPDC049598 TaxID=3154626 RepID=UPI003427A7C7